MFFVSHPIKKIFRDPPALETKRLVLRKILPRDTKDMFEYSAMPETSRYLLWETHESPAFTRAHIMNLRREYRAMKFFDWGLILKENGKFIGTCGFTTINEKALSAEIGYVLSPLYHKKGLASEAVAAVLDFGFCTLGLTEIHARFMGDNADSRALLLRFGFSDATVSEEYIKKRGKDQKIYTYSLSAKKYFH